MTETLRRMTRIAHCICLILTSGQILSKFATAPQSVSIPCLQPANQVSPTPELVTPDALLNTPDFVLEKLEKLSEAITTEIDTCLRFHKFEQDDTWDKETCPLEMKDTEIEKLPTGEEKWTFSHNVKPIDDATATLLSCAYEASASKDIPPCRIGLTLDTEIHASYVQYNAGFYNYKGILSIGLGGFSKNLSRTNIDIEVDKQSRNGGRQKFEKMVSSKYMAEMCRRLIVRSIPDVPKKARKAQTAGKTLKSRKTRKSRLQGGLTRENLKNIFEDKGPKYTETQKALADAWGWEVTEQNTLQTVHYLVTLVFNRSADFAAAAIASIYPRTIKWYDNKSEQEEPKEVSVGIGGWLYTKHPLYRHRLRSTLDKLLKDDGEKVNLILIHGREVRPWKGGARGASLRRGASSAFASSGGYGSLYVTSM